MDAAHGAVDYTAVGTVADRCGTGGTAVGRMRRILGLYGWRARKGTWMHVDIGWVIGAVSMMAGGIAWLVGLHWRQKGHEDICALRYAAIEANHAKLVEDNGKRFDRLDDKLDRLLER